MNCGYQLARTLALLVMLLALPGCFSERSFPMVPGRIVRVSPGPVQANGQPLATREWVARVHAAAAERLPFGERAALTTDELAPDGKVVDVWSYFHLDPQNVDSLWGNLPGIQETAQVISPPPPIETDAEGVRHIRRDAWEGFETVAVPVAGGAELCARLGVPSKQNAIPGSYVIVTHGLFGSMDGEDVQNHVQALRQAGHHVLALEMRGHGETQIEHPDYAMTFGIRESADLLDAARWLKATHGATRVGLVSFSLTGYEAVLAAWLDGKKPVTEFSTVPLLADLPRPQESPAFNGGLFVVSMPAGIVNLADRFEPRVNLWCAPSKATFQAHVEARLLEYKQPAGYGIWALAAEEFERSGFKPFYGTFDKAKTDLVRFIDMNGAADGSQGDWRVGATRMENVRVPMVILSAANDPLGTAQNVADLFGRQNNPNIGVILLHGGGHMGFTALSADYYYSLLLNFFDPRTAPGVVE